MPVDPGSPTFDLRSTTPQPPVDPNKPVPMSTAVMRSNLVHGAKPVYPPEAQKNKITGVVVMHAVIAKDGSVAKVDVISGPAELRQAAIDAVKQWKYKPTTLNGTPVQVLTQINLNFHP
jgi:protein TonB